MKTNKHEVLVVISIVILVVYTLALSTLTQVMSSIQTNTKISNQGSLKTVGVGVYWDSGLTSRVSSINWGLLEPGSNVNKTVYIRNEGNAAAVLSITTSNWSPSNSSSYLNLNWDYGGQTINVSEVVKVKLTLSTLASINGITSFSFDITIVASS